MVCHSSACQTISVTSVYIKTKLTITGAVHIATCNEKTALTFKKKQNLLATFLSLKENSGFINSMSWNCVDSRGAAFQCMIRRHLWIKSYIHTIKHRIEQHSLSLSDIRHYRKI